MLYQGIDYSIFTVYVIVSERHNYVVIEIDVRRNERRNKIIKCQVVTCCVLWMGILLNIVVLCMRTCPVLTLFSTQRRDLVDFARVNR